MFAHRSSTSCSWRFCRVFPKFRKFQFWWFFSNFKCLPHVLWEFWLDFLVTQYHGEAWKVLESYEVVFQFCNWKIFPKFWRFCKILLQAHLLYGHITIKCTIGVSLGVKNESCERVKAMFSGWWCMSWVLISAISEHKKVSIFFNQQICIKEWLSGAFYSLFLLENLVVIITDQSQQSLSQSDQTYTLEKFYSDFCWWYSKKKISDFSWEIIT